MYVSETKNCVNVSFTFDKTKVAKQALLDSGATDNFIDQRTAKRLNIPTRRSSDLWYVSVKLGPGPSIQALLKIQIVAHKGVK